MEKSDEESKTRVFFKCSGILLNSHHKTVDLNLFIAGDSAPVTGHQLAHKYLASLMVGMVQKAKIRTDFTHPTLETCTQHVHTTIVRFNLGSMCPAR